MPTCRRPRQPTGVGRRCNSEYRPQQRRRWSQTLDPYSQPLRRRVAPSPSPSPATQATQRACSAAESPAQLCFLATDIEALRRLTLEEWSICNLMASLLQHKTKEEAERITAEVTQLALHRRLLAGYSGVYADSSPSGEEYTQEAEDEDGRAELIRRLQEQQRREEERRRHLRGYNRKRQQENLRATCRNIFCSGVANGNLDAAGMVNKRRGLTYRRNTFPEGIPSRRQRQREKQKHMQEQKQQCSHDNGEEVMVTKAPVSVPSVSPNIPRRTKSLKGVPSFDEACADRYGGSAYSNESTPSVSLGSYAAMSAADDSVRRSTSLPSAGATYFDRYVKKSTWSTNDAAYIDAHASPLMASTTRPSEARVAVSELCTSASKGRKPPRLLDEHHRAGLLPVQATNPQCVKAKLASSSLLSSLTSPSSSSIGNDTEQGQGGGPPRW
ncbi:hypothetical protein TraAM80_06618 [Trypanosoma rangeli]|uniref:Uncharacterized protein n=1 Tax=Trypanosoma rangeli TaxID=5698 RepID=A0A422N9B8_TRYRA|nr:uncharacterized protein TraAM80_06618 [Trypanosoma rangeli]RNF02074.1 hypothetical protein TraAM80_06618 [Trypanosoma rangeli]|eukprot:RNF02074.1 hypothetical protein TraAM80_06618 [Trypanosoma rangeli]